MDDEDLKVIELAQDTGEMEICFDCIIQDKCPVSEPESFTVVNGEITACEYKKKD